MLYNLLYPLATEFHFLNVFKYLTFRTITSAEPVKAGGAEPPTASARARAARGGTPATGPA